MKRITNILSYLWLLLLMAVTACSDLEEEVGPMQGDEEVELTIPVEIPGMKAATRTVPTENITQITAIAFDENGNYIRTRQAVLNRTVDNSGNSTRGTLRIKVPSKTRSIHFLSKNNSNEAFAGIQSLDNLKYYTQTWELHYWGFLSFTSTTELKAFNRFLTLYRNQAMITLEAGNDDYIAGFVNYNTSGTMVPYSNEHGFGFRIASQNGVVYQTIPNGVSKQTDGNNGNNNLGKAHYLFEHENNKNNQPLYAVCKIGSKFYKVAFARTINNNLTYFPIIRNHEYKIVVDPTQINTAYGFDYYDDAKDSPSPINDVVITTVDLSLNPTTQDLIINAGGEKKCTVTVTVPQGITNLKVSAPEDANGVDVFTITPPDGVTINAEGEYIVNPNQQYTFTFTLADNYNTTGTATIEFSGSGSYYKTNKASATIYLKKNGQLTVNPTTATIDNTAGTKQDISVTIPQNMNINKLQISTDAFEVSSNNGLSLQNGYYNVSPNNTYSFTFTLKQGYDNSTDDQIITFTGTSDHWTATGTSTITLREPTEVREVEILAEPYTRSLNYTTYDNSESDLIVNVTIPAEVTTLNFSSEYFDVISANGRTKKETVDGEEVSTPYITGSGPYTVNHQNVGELTLPFRLRLKSEKKAPTSSAGYTFGGSGEGVTVTPATISNITLTESGDENVRWQGDVPLNWGNEGAVTQIPLPYSWFEGISAGSTLQVEYVITDLNNPEIQFAEVDGEWNNPNEDSYFFPELEVTMNDGGKMGLNLNKNSQPKNIGSQTGIVYTYDLTITQAVLDNIIEMNNRNITLLGESNVVMAIQGGNVRLKKISVIPNNQADNNQLDIELDFYAAKNGNQNFDYGNSFTDLLLNTSHVYLKAKISSEDAAKYDGKQVILTGTYPSQNAEIGGLAIHWVDSKKSVNNNNNIWYTNNTGESLQFNVHSGILEYVIEWVFVTGQYYKGGDIGFTYNISNYAISGVDGTFNNFAGDTSATIGFTNEPIYLDIYSDADTDAGNDISIVSGSQLVMKATLSSDIAPGTQITFDLSGSTGDIMSGITWNDRAGQSVQFSWPDITLTVVENQRDYYLYWNPTVSDERSATLNFTVSGNYNLNSVGNTSYSKAITVSRTVIDDEDFSNFKNVGPGSVSVEDGILCLTNNTDCQNAWDAQAMYETNGIEYGETYTLTFKAKIANNTQGAMAVAIQRFENGECVATDHYRIFTINEDWAEFTYDITIQDNDQETPNENKPTHFMFNFGDLIGTLYIDDLRLVKKN